MKIQHLIALLAVFVVSFAHASPPFNPGAALNWCIDTVVSPIPKADRIYVLGPDKTKEAYGLNNEIAYHDLQIRQAVQFSKGMILSDLFEYLPKYRDKDLLIHVWRVSSKEKPLYSNGINEATSAKFSLRPNDIVQVCRPEFGLIH